MSEFSDRPLVAGTIVGLRSFKIDTLGRLTGVSHQDVWRPGENVAVCHANSTKPPVTGYLVRDPINIDVSHQPTLSAFAAFGSTAVQSTYTITSRSVETIHAKVDLRKHVVATVNCSCGYYAYFDDESNPYHSDDQILGVVSGYGVVTVGTRGFRASKAEIVGLIVPQQANLSGRYDDLTRAQRRAHRRQCSESYHYGSHAAIGRQILARDCTLRPSVHRYRDPRRTVSLYNLPTFSNVDEAMKRFGIAPPVEADPTLDSDFWKRSAS